MTRNMRAQIKLGAELGMLTAPELRSEMRRLDALVETRLKTIVELRRQIGVLQDGYRDAVAMLRDRGS